jgi:hypothetical protein
MITIGPVRTGASFGLGRSRMAGLQGRRCHRPACEQLAGTTTTPNVRAAGIAMSGGSTASAMIRHRELLAPRVPGRSGRSESALLDVGEDDGGRSKCMTGEPPRAAIELIAGLTLTPPVFEDRGRDGAER